jgi:hypothetical protein
MEMSVIELVLRHAVQRGVLNADDVNAAMDRMWGSRAAFLEATKIPQTRPQDKESKTAEASRRVQRGIDGRGWPLKLGSWWRVVEPGLPERVDRDYQKYKKTACLAGRLLLCAAVASTPRLCVHRKKRALVPVLSAAPLPR